MTESTTSVFDFPDHSPPYQISSGRKLHPQSPPQKSLPPPKKFSHITHILPPPLAL